MCKNLISIIIIPLNECCMGDGKGAKHFVKYGILQNE